MFHLRLRVEVYTHLSVLVVNRFVMVSPPCVHVFVMSDSQSWPAALISSCSCNASIGLSSNTHHCGTTTSHNRWIPMTSEEFFTNDKFFMVREE